MCIIFCLLSFTSLCVLLSGKGSPSISVSYDCIRTSMCTLVCLLSFRFLVFFLPNDRFRTPKCIYITFAIFTFNMIPSSSRKFSIYCCLIWLYSIIHVYYILFAIYSVSMLPSSRKRHILLSHIIVFDFPCVVFSVNYLFLSHFIFLQEKLLRTSSLLSHTVILELQCVLYSYCYLFPLHMCFIRRNGLNILLNLFHRFWNSMWKIPSTCFLFTGTGYPYIALTNNSFPYVLHSVCYLSLL